MKPESKDTPTAAPRALEPGVSVHDWLPVGHRHRLRLEKALRVSLRELSGRWDVSVHAVGRILLQVDVVAPDGSRWSLAVPVPQGPEAEDIAETVRAGCARLRRVKPALAEPGGDGGQASAAGSSRTGSLLRASKPAPAEKA